MRKFAVLALLALLVASAAGCNSCRPRWNWFSHGDNCDPCVSGAPVGVGAMYSPGMVVPGGPAPAPLPGPIEVAPVN